MDTGMIKDITSFLGGGWLSVGIGVLLIGLLIWWSIYKHKIKVEAATQKTLEEREAVEKQEQEKTRDQDVIDKEGRDDVDKFLNPSGKD